jgi:hypothetical protein
MSRKRDAGIVPALAWVLAALFLAAGLPMARADETADLRALHEFLEHRLDDLAQTAPRMPAGSGEPVVAGSFPRSFAVPGTDVSLRIGGQGYGSVLWYIKGSAAGGGLGGQGGLYENCLDGQGSTCNLPSIPLNTHTFASGSIGFAHSRGSEWDFSGKQSRIFLDARTPGPYGEVKAYIEFDFSSANPNTTLNNNQGSVNGYVPRFRQGYAAMGGLLMGQTQGTFTDNDSLPELVDLASQTGIPFVARTPQIRYTFALPNGMSVAVAAEHPNPNAAGPFGMYFTDTNQIPNMSACAALTTSTATNTTNITNACLGNAAFFNPLQDLIPTFVVHWRIEQPWGHIQVGASTVGYTLNDGMYLHRSFLGYGGSVSGNFFTWGKDNLTWGLAGGDGLGDQIANNMGVATNFGGALVGQAFNATDSRSFFSTNRALYDAAVLVSTITSFSARVAYQHWWTPELRSTADFSMNHNDIPAFIQASGRGANNKELTLTHANLMWSPVAFVDLGIEGAWGHRVVVSNLKGDAWTMQTSMRVRF